MEVTIKWKQPPDNGDPITKYTVYQRTTKDNGSLGDWNKLYEINDPLEREAILQLVKGKEYEFVVTATNKFGESLKEEGKIKKIIVLGGMYMQGFFGGNFECVCRQRALVLFNFSS